MFRFEETDWDRNYQVQSLPNGTRRTDPLGQNTEQESSYQRAYHLQNFHDKGYETSITRTNYDPFSQNNHHRKQHFVRGVIPGGSGNNKMIYGTEELLRQAEEKKKLARAEKPDGFLYGTEAATNVGKPKASTRPNNALWLEQRVHDDHISINKQMAITVQDDLERHKKEKERKMIEQQQEKKKDFEMLRSYEPWGRPGGGAPRSDGSGPNKWEARRTRAVTTLKNEEYNPMGRAGGGAPNRTVSGKPLTQLRGDPELRFPTYGQSGDVAPSLRYKQDKKYGEDLKNFMDDVRARKELQRQQSFEQELCHNNQNPFGKQGGGAPMKDDRGGVKAYYPTTLSKNMEELRGVESRHPHAYNDTQSMEPSNHECYDPWGKGYGAVDRTRSGKVIKPPKPKTNDANGIGIPAGRSGAGAPIIDNDGRIRTRKPQTLTKNNYGQVMSRDFSPKERHGNVYNPFGKPGAGAPIRDADGKVNAHLNAQMEHDDGKEYDRQAKQTYLKTLQDLRDQNYEKRKAEYEELKTSGGDVESWIKRGVVGQPKFDPKTNEIIATHRTTSDVTQQKLNIRPQKNETSRKYHHELEAQLELKQKQKYQEREHEIQDSLKHVNTMNQQWGRPGAGAPLVDRRRQKVELAPFDEVNFRLN